MSRYICNAPLRFSGKDYAMGDIVPDGIILPRRARALIVSKHLTELSDTEDTVTHKTDSHGSYDSNIINIPIHSDNDLISLTMSSQDVVDAISTVQLTTEAACDSIRQIKSDDVLILLHAIEKRKGVLKVIEEQHATLAVQAGGDAVGENV